MGYRSVLIVNMILAALSLVSFLYVPVYTADYKQPHAILAKANDTEVYTLVDVVWPMCQDPNPTARACTDSEAFPMLMGNLSEALTCPEEDFLMDEDYTLEENLVGTMDLTNGTFCAAFTDSDVDGAIS